MMLFDKARLQKALEQYRKDFPDWWKKEGKYKWTAVETFQRYWDADASDFLKMLNQALSEAKKIMPVWGGNNAKNAIISLAKKAPEETRILFKALFDEDRDVIDRIQEFKKKSAALYRQNGGTGQGQLQGESTITTYLWLRYPDKYYIYKMNALCALAIKIGFIYSFREGSDTSHLNDKKRIKEFHDLYDEIRSYISKDEDLINIVNKNFTDAAYYKDLKHKTLTADFAFYMYSKEKNNDSYDGYWWIAAKSDDFSSSEISNDIVQSYPLRNKKGTYRQIKNNFLNVKAGNKIIEFEPFSNKKIVALAEIAEDQKGDDIKICKIKDVTTNIDYNKLQTIPELQNMEFFRSLNGRLFKLNKTEYDCIIKLINGTYEYPKPYPDSDDNPTSDFEKYSKEDFLKEVFLTEDQYDKLLKILEQKKNIILKGVPGVGKTYVAELLAYSMMGEKDNNRIQLIQFHQNYSYEDFIKGYKPKDDGFELKEGVFYEFCKKAAANKAKGPFFFIIDEINRGNMSKIFGELLMMIEYREKKVILAYDKEEFFVPDNLYIIGTMNTADRSIAMIDYALRRRFSHFELEPAFSTKEGMKKFKAWLRDNGSNKKVLTKLITKIRKLNRAITKDLGKGFCIGHSYFCKENLTKEDLELIVDYEIIPTLEQYWFDDPYKVIGWSKLLRGEIAISEVDNDDFEEKIKEELTKKEKEELEELEAEENEELSVEENEGDNAEGTTAK